MAFLDPIKGAADRARLGRDRQPDARQYDALATHLVAQQDGVTVTVFAFEIVGDRIKQIWAVRNPEKLHPWTMG